MSLSSSLIFEYLLLTIELIAFFALLPAFKLLTPLETAFPVCPKTFPATTPAAAPSKLATAISDTEPPSKAALVPPSTEPNIAPSTE